MRFIPPCPIASARLNARRLFAPGRPQMPDGYAFGLDLGNPGEFSALALVEKAAPPGDDAEPLYSLRDLKRFPPGATFNAIAGELWGRREKFFPDRIDPHPLREARVAVDITATGREVLDTLRLGDHPPELVPIALTMGLASTYDEQGNFRTSKRDRVTRLQVLLQAKRFRIARTLENAELLVKELMAYRPKVKLGADPSQADWRDGQADDLIFAVALALWQVDRLPVPAGEPSVGMLMQGEAADRIRRRGALQSMFADRFGRGRFGR
jgi:hypothetical protein